MCVEVTGKNPHPSCSLEDKNIVLLCKVSHELNVTMVHVGAVTSL